LDRVAEMTEPESGVETTQERLSHGDVATESLLASAHLHRYELAAELVEGLRVLDLCCGTGYGSLILAQRAAAVRGVDNDEETVAVAGREAGSSQLKVPVEFVHADALDHLSELDPKACDAVVCFEGIEHVLDPLALVDAMASLARQGTRLIVSLPNGRGFEEDNPFHVTEFGYEEAIRLFAKLGDPVVISQFLTEGSLLVDGDKSGRDLAGRLVGDAHPAPEWANNWVAVVNVPHTELRRAVARLRISASANQNEYMRALERANLELERTNRRLAGSWLGVHDAAAATVVRRVEELEQRLAMESQALQAPRYRAVDKLREIVLAIPGAGRLLRALWRRVWRT
jgi:2-polyprenyl-3-methyl-5-hydroxy-6-metoxy-1,4-benzoquinol methylase